MPASFTISDLSEDEEAFILNVPSKVYFFVFYKSRILFKNKNVLAYIKELLTTNTSIND